MIDSDANGELFEEQVEIILKAFAQKSFHHEGRSYGLDEISPVPRPVTRSVECWQPICKCW